MKECPVAIVVTACALHIGCADRELTLEPIEELTVAVEELPEAAVVPLPEVEFCVPQLDENHWLPPTYRNSDGSDCELGPACDNVVYQCVEVSELAQVYTSSSPESDTDCSGAALRRIAFVIDGIAGELRYNASTCDAPHQATLIAFAGGGGTFWRDGYVPNIGYRGRDADGENDYRALEEAGIRVVGVKWQPGVYRPGWDLGWMSRKSGEGQSVPAMLVRPAAIAEFIAHNIHEPGLRFGVSGTSAGSLQSTSVLVHDIGIDIDYLGLHSGGGLVAALPFTCGQATDVRVRSQDGELCFFGELCGNLAGAAEVPESIQAVVDYIIAADDCTSEDGDTNTLWASSLELTAWNGRVPNRLGFLVNNNWRLVDNELGATWSTGVMRAFIEYRLGIVGEWANVAGLHGDVMVSGHPSMAAYNTQVTSALLE